MYSSTLSSRWGSRCSSPMAELRRGEDKLTAVRARYVRRTTTRPIRSGGANSSSRWRPPVPAANHAAAAAAASAAAVAKPRITALRRVCDGCVARFGEHLTITRRSASGGCQAGRARDDAGKMRAVVRGQLLPSDALHQDARRFGANIRRDRLEPALRAEQPVELVGEEARRASRYRGRGRRCTDSRERRRSPTAAPRREARRSPRPAAHARRRGIRLRPATLSRSSARGRPDSRRAQSCRRPPR